MNKKAAKFLVFILGIGLVIWVSRFFNFDVEAVRSWFSGVPLWLTSPAFVLLYVVLTFIFWFSKDIFRIAAALVFGAYLSTLLVWIAEIINAFVLFYFARFMGRGFIEDSTRGALKGLDARLKGTGFFWLFMFRAAPFIPFRFLDLAAGLTGISFRKYLAAAVAGSLPRIFWLQFILAAVGKNIFTDFGALVTYLRNHPALLWVNFAYLILIVVVAVKLKRRDKCQSQ
jgi:uncharacterized membrane protein YdjX (TVP38/TMEM64 family)